MTSEVEMYIAASIITLVVATVVGVITFAIVIAFSDNFILVAIFTIAMVCVSIRVTFKSITGKYYQGRSS